MTKARLVLDRIELTYSDVNILENRKLKNVAEALEIFTYKCIEGTTKFVLFIIIM